MSFELSQHGLADAAHPGRQGHIHGRVEASNLHVALATSHVVKEKITIAGRSTPSKGGGAWTGLEDDGYKAMVVLL